MSLRAPRLHSEFQISPSWGETLKQASKKINKHQKKITFLFLVYRSVFINTNLRLVN